MVFVPSDRLVDIFALMARHERQGAKEGSLSLAAAEITNVTGAGIVLSPGDSQMTNFGTSNDVATELLELEMTLREGPYVDACAGEVAEDVDLLSSSKPRWILYTPSAIDIGARAVFSFPVRIGSIRLGALGLYRDEPGELTYEQSSDAFLMASVVARAMLALQSGSSGEDLSEELEREATFDFTIHQAAGMLSVQARMNVGDALVLLRTHAFATSRSISAMAARIINRETAYDEKSGTWYDEGDIAI
jgi:hypothetical protein